MTTPLAAGDELLGLAADADRRRGRRGRRGTRGARRRRGRRSSRPGRRAASGIAFASPERLSTRTIPVAPAACARLAFESERAAAARDERDRAGQRVGAGAACRPPFGSRRPQSCAVHRLRRRARRSSRRRRASGRRSPRRRGASDRAPERDPREGRRARPRRDARAPARRRACSRRAATVIASGAVPGEPAVPKPKSSRSFPAEITGTTPAAATLRDRLDQRVVRGLGLRAAAGEVDHVHAVADRRLEGGDDLGRVRRRGRPASGR